MSRHRSPLRDRAAFGELPPDLYVVPGPWPRLARPVKHDVETWRVIDDWPARVPVTDAEVDVFEAWFGDLFDELFGPSRCMTVPLPAAPYLRVSTARQAEHDVSIPEQKRQGEAYCQSHGYQLARTYVEPGASAAGDGASGRFTAS